MSNIETILQAQVIDAVKTKQRLTIVGGSTKGFYGREAVGEAMDVSYHKGIVDYDPTELVLTARGGTPLIEVNRLLEENNQMLGFEPPAFGQDATLGGVIASGLSGPARPFRGSVRDFVLGAKILTGSGNVLQFGGRVMKNVAGFDVSRLMVGAMGTLGVILEVSVKVLPKPASEMTVTIDEPDIDLGIRKMNELSAKPWPISGMSWYQDKVWIRLSGTRVGVTRGHQYIGGDLVETGEEFWEDSREQKLDFFDSDIPILRFSCKPGAATLGSDNGQTDSPEVVHPPLIEWAGGVRWFKQSNDSGGSQEVLPRQALEETGSVVGQWTQFRNGYRNGEVFALPSPHALIIQQNLKKTFDPEGILNIGRLYSAF